MLLCIPTYCSLELFTKRRKKWKHMHLDCLERKWVLKVRGLANDNVQPTTSTSQSLLSLVVLSAGSLTFLQFTLFPDDSGSLVYTFSLFS